jgi:pimeloyl-ACP methyl ester carboxylesterase
MQTHLLVRYALAIALAIAAAAAEAKEVTLRHRGLTLNANLELAAGKTPADGVILITHGTLAHRGMKIVVDLQKQLRELGHNTLAINLSLGLDDRHGGYDCATTHRHRYDDAVAEIDAWVGWLRTQGVNRVTLLGHSRGGLQTALYAAERDHASVTAMVLLAPAIRENAEDAAYRRIHGKPLAPVLEEARKLVDAGKGEAVLEHIGFLTCPDAAVTADTFVSYYGQGLRHDTPDLTRKIKKPTLVVVAGNDNIVVGLDKKVAPLADGDRVRMKVIDDADHFFVSLFTDEAVEATDAFLRTIGRQSGSNSDKK